MNSLRTPFSSTPSNIHRPLLLEVEYVPSVGVNWPLVNTFSRGSSRPEPNLLTSLPFLFPKFLLKCAQIARKCALLFLILCSIKPTFIPTQHNRFCKEIVKINVDYFTIIVLQHTRRYQVVLKGSCLAVDQMRHLMEGTFLTLLMMANEQYNSELHAAAQKGRSLALCFHHTKGKITCVMFPP